MAAPAVLAEGLVKRYGGFEAVKGIDLLVRSGQTFGFLGPNGAGKTSTMRMIYGLSPVTAGKLEVLGLDVTTSPREIKRRIGVVPQETNLDETMTVRENLLVHGRFFDLVGKPLRARADELLEFVALTEKADQRAVALSGGMKRRLLIARALMNDPELLVLDEPTTGLDPQSRHLVWEKIRGLRAAGKTVLLTSHYLDEIERLADRIVLIDRGVIIEEGTPLEVTRKHAGKEVVEVQLTNPEDAPRLIGKVGSLVTGRSTIGGDLLLKTEEGDRLVEAVVESGIPTERASLRRATLEDAFLALTGRTLGE